MMKSKRHRLVRGFLVWEVVSSLLLLLFSVSDYKKTWGALPPNFLVDFARQIALLAVPGLLTVLLCLAATYKLGGIKAVLIGFIVGAACLPLGGALLYGLFPSFEGASIVAFSVLLGIPAGIAGAVTGWNKQANAN